MKKIIISMILSMVSASYLKSAAISSPMGSTRPSPQIKQLSSALEDALSLGMSGQFETALRQIQAAHLNAQEIKSLVLAVGNDGYAYNTLHNAVLFKRTDMLQSIVNLLHESGIRGQDMIDVLQATDAEGDTSLMMAIASESPEMIEIILNAALQEGDITPLLEYKNKRGEDVLMFAVTLLDAWEKKIDKQKAIIDTLMQYLLTSSDGIAIAENALRYAVQKRQDDSSAKNFATRGVAIKYLQNIIDQSSSAVLVKSALKR